MVRAGVASAFLLFKRAQKVIFTVAAKKLVVGDDCYCSDLRVRAFECVRESMRSDVRAKTSRASSSTATHLRLLRRKQILELRHSAVDTLSELPRVLLEPFILLHFHVLLHVVKHHARSTPLSSGGGRKKASFLRVFGGGGKEEGREGRIEGGRD